MSKEAIVFVIDSGYSMKSNALKSSIAIIKRMLEIIMFKNRKNDHVGIVTVGSLKTINRLYEQGQGYENITEFGLLKEKEDILERPTREHLMYLLGIEHETNADIFEGTIIAVKMLMDHCISKKTGKPLAFNKKIYIFTDCKSPVQFDYLDTVIDQCDSNSISITIVGFNLDLGQSDACSMMRLCQRKNPALGSFFSGEEALESVQEFATKEVSLTTLYRGPLTFGESTSHLDCALSIDVYVYNKTSELKFNSAKKFSSLAEKVPKDLNDKNFGTVETVYEYKVRKDEDIPGISEDKGQIVTEIFRGFRYGSHIIPFTPEDQEAALFTTKKSFQILYFTDASSIKREYFVGNVKAVIPDPICRISKLRFETLLAAMYENPLKEKVAVVRFCRTDKSPPKFGILKYMKKGYGHLINLPYSDEIRYFTFEPHDFLRMEKINSLSKASSNTKKQPQFPESNKSHPLNKRLVACDVAKQAVDAFIDDMFLPNEAFSPKNVYNPSIQIMRQMISYRFLHPDEPLPRIDGKITKLLQPKTADLKIKDNLLACFSLQKVVDSKTLNNIKSEKTGNDISKFISLGTYQPVKVVKPEPINFDIDKQQHNFEFDSVEKIEAVISSEQIGEELPNVNYIDRTNQTSQENNGKTLPNIVHAEKIDDVTQWESIENDSESNSDVIDIDQASEQDVLDFLFD